MNFVLTLVSSSADAPLTQDYLDQVISYASKHDVEVIDNPVWLEDGKAADLFISAPMPREILSDLRNYLDQAKIDVFQVKSENRRKKLLLADMDSTIVTSETLDELADYAGLKHQVSEITALAMEGKLDFHGAVRERVSLLKNLPIEKLQETLDQIEISKGALSLVKTMREHGAQCVLVSGGFTFFTGAIAKKVGFHAHHGNTLGIDEDKGVLNGRVIDPILDKHAKVRFLEHYQIELNLLDSDCMTIGDGANDIPMLEIAGLGVGYHPKETVKQAVDNIIVHGDLSAALYAQGYKGSDIIKA